MAEALRQIRPISIGGHALKNNLILAPLAGYTDFSFRDLCTQFGAALCFTEMVSCKGLAYNNENTKELLCIGDYEKVKGVQIFGSDPEIMRRACESEYLSPFDIVDINMGCPMQKVYKNGEGSALLQNLPLAEKIVSECVKSGKTVTVKFRIGLSADQLITAEFARLCEGAGASAVFIHGRTRDKIYAGEPDYREIAAAKTAVKIPVIANGGVVDRASAEKLFDETGADGIMLARGAMMRPTLFCELLGTTPPFGVKETVLRQTRAMLEKYGERRTVVHMRKMTAFYIKGLRNSASYKDKLFRCDSIVEFYKILNIIFSNCS